VLILELATYAKQQCNRSFMLKYGGLSILSLSMSPTEIIPSLQLNTRGLRCPEPVMMLHQAIRKSKAGDVVEVFATDNSTSWDIPKFCMHLGHELLLQEERLDENGNKEFHYLVKKGG